MRLSAEALIGINPEFARWSRGARLSRDSAGILGSTAPLTITFGPDLEWDDTTRLLGSLGFLDEVDILIPPELGQSRPDEVGGQVWSLIEPENGIVGATWGSETRQTSRGLFWFSNFEVANLNSTFAEQLGADPARALAMFRALQVHHGAHMRNLFVTRSEGILHTRSADVWPRVIGQCTPEEALVLAGLLLRRREPFHQRVTKGTQINARAFDWYTGAAQLSVPRYRGLYAHLVKEAQLADDAESKPVAYLEGVLTRVKHLLRVHDQLGLLHLIEADADANNDTVDRQTQHFYQAADAAIGIFDGLAGLVAHLEGHLPAGDREWRRVTFPELRAGQRPWVKGLARYASAVPAAGAAWTPLLSLATDERVQSFHRYPARGVVAQFGKTFEIRKADGSTEPRFIQEVTIGCMKPVEGPADMSWVTQGRDGILLIGDQLYLLPWMFVRALTRDLLKAIDVFLEAICATDGVATASPATDFLVPDGQDLASRMLSWDCPLIFPPAP